MQIGQFQNIGDWLIWRSTGLFGEFQIYTCINIIATEGIRDRWIYSVTHDDVVRILARYKEHVSYWNISIEVIRNELTTLSTQLALMGYNFLVLASIFDQLKPLRIPPTPPPQQPTI